MRSFELVLQFHSENEADAAKVLLEKFVPVLKTIQADNDALAFAYVREVRDVLISEMQ